MTNQPLSFTQTLLSLFGFTLFFFVFGYMALDAIERETQWRQERHCKYYGAEINAYAAEHGKDAPC